MFNLFQKEGIPNAEKTTASLLVQVQDAAGTPLSAIRVVVLQNGKTVAKGLTNALGQWQADLPPGIYSVTIGDIPTRSQTIELKLNERTEISFVGQKSKVSQSQESLPPPPARLNKAKRFSDLGDLSNIKKEELGQFLGGKTLNQVFGSSPCESHTAFYSSDASFQHGGNFMAKKLQSFPATFDTEDYGHTEEAIFLDPKDHPVSTFSVDVDTASYSNARRFLQQGKLPPADAVRLEEFLNYFDYDYPQPTGEHPLEITTELAACPWAEERKLLLVGIQGKRLETSQVPPSHFVLLLDVSGSMGEPNKLPLVQQSARMFVEQLRPSDRVSIVTYANHVSVALPPTLASEKEKICSVVDGLHAGGGTSGGPALQTAYELARQHLVFGGNNRILLCTDGDFNLGVSSDSELVRMVERERESGVYLSILGYGMGNLKDHKLLQIAGKGNGNYRYVDTLPEARKVLVEEFAGTVFTIADNVKIQVEFNPERVAGYRLLGYEKRLLRREDFNNDKIDAAEVGAGHRVTALYDIVPAGKTLPGTVANDPLKYQQVQPAPAAASEDLLTLKLRYILPQSGKESRLLEKVVADRPLELSATSDNFRLASAAAGFALLLRDSPHKGSLNWELARRLASGALGKDSHEYRKELCVLIRNAEVIAQAKSAEVAGF